MNKDDPWRVFICRRLVVVVVVVGIDLDSLQLCVYCNEEEEEEEEEAFSSFHAHSYFPHGLSITALG